MPVLSRFAIYVNHSDETGVVEIHQMDDQRRPIDPVALIITKGQVEMFASLYSEIQQSAIATLEADNTALTMQRDAANASKSALETQVANLAAQKTTLQTTVEQLTTSQAELVRRVEELKLVSRWETRSIAAKHFETRLDRYDLKILYGFPDATVELFRDWLKQKISLDEVVSLDVDKITEYLAYQVSAGLLTVDRVKELTRDSTQQESVAG